MNYQNLVLDFVNRTKANLEIIERLAEKEAHLFVKNSTSEIELEEVEAYEITQLVNSMLGLIVFPQQRYFNHIPQTPLSELERLGWPKPLISGELPSDLKTLKDLMRYIRNSIAHFNIEFQSDDDHRITGIKIWNRRNGQENWTASLRIEELRQLLDKFTDLVLNF